MKNMNFKIPKLFVSKSECCGCAACAAICPQKAIDMLQDDEGFLYPQINEEKCVRCGLCIKVCSFK